MIEKLSAMVSGLPLLSSLILAPAIAAVAVAAVRNPQSARRLGVAGAAIALILSILALAAFRPAEPGMQLVERMQWLPSIGVGYVLGLDGLSVMFLPLTTLMFLGILLVAPEAGPRGRWVVVNFLVLEAATLGAYVATDAVLFFIFFELALVPAYFLVKLSGVGSEPALVARRYVVFMLLGSLPILAGFLLAAHDARTAAGAVSFDVAHLVAARLSPEVELAVFTLLLFGFAVKAPALPLHAWMPQSVAAAPVGLVAYLLGLKLGTYGLLRFVIPMAPSATHTFAPWVIGVEVLAIIYAGLIAITRRDLRSVLVFSSISHVGLITAAAFSGTIDGWQGAILLMLNAGIATAGLALCIGMIERRVGTTSIRSLGGLVHRAPRLSAVVFIVGLALIGVPGTSGFAGEILALRGVFQFGPAFGVIAAAGVVLSASYFLWAYQRAFLGEVRTPAVAAMRDLDRRESAVGFGLIALSLALGLFPSAATDLSRATVASHVSRHVQEAKQANGRNGGLPVEVSIARPAAPPR